MLTYGTVIATVVVTAGLVVAFAGGGVRHDARPLPDVLAAGEPASIVAVGLLALTLLPPVLVAVAAVAFWRRGERRYALLSSLVLGLLVAGLIAAVAAAPAGG